MKPFFIQFQTVTPLGGNPPVLVYALDDQGQIWFLRVTAKAAKGEWTRVEEKP